MGTGDESDVPEVEPISLRPAANPDELSLDPYSIVALLNDTTTAGLSSFADVAIESDTLRLRVAYEGGCAEHEFTLVAFGSFLESHPLQMGVVLVHDAHGDACQQQIETELRFDLTPLAEAYRPLNGPSGRIVLRPDERTDERGFPRIEYRF